LAAHFFRSRKVARRRLVVLEKNGLISSNNMRSPSGFKVYGLTAKGHACIIQRYHDMSLPKKLRSPVSAEYQHDRMVAISRVFLSKTGRSIMFRSERELASDVATGDGYEAQSLRPDGLFRDSTNSLWALEYELSVKSKKRLIQKVANHDIYKMFYPGCSSLFIVKNKKVTNFLKEQNMSGVTVLESYMVENWFEKRIRAM